jgi:hypothetical protein
MNKIMEANKTDGGRRQRTVGPSAGPSASQEPSVRMEEQVLAPY